MTLARATFLDGTPVDLPGSGPYSSEALEVLFKRRFLLPAQDRFVLGEGDDAHAYLDAAKSAWASEAEWMDFLDLDSPAYDLKTAERDLYMWHWTPFLEGVETVLDVGCGIGRFTAEFLDRGATVWGVDADLESLIRCAWHSARRAGKLDLSWAGVHTLPDVQVDAVVACEVLCYVPDLDAAMQEIAARLKPGGVLLMSMEARYGWATAEDAAPGQLAAALADEDVLEPMPGRPWVRLHGHEDMTNLLERNGFDVAHLQATHYVTDGPLERVAPDELTFEALRDADAAARNHPVWAPLNRIWTAVGRKR
ncbi:MAG: class I SAM-dependent methyltransferase [Proteobacteria bacterium]|nr:class I SAM-dependent methyltransferase [Pseudomonadota bacterium]